MTEKNRIRILIADDHPIFRKGLRDVIASDASLELMAEMADGATAWRMIEMERPAVAVLDFHMPGMTGIEILRAIWKKKLPVKTILLTMYDDDELFDEAMSLGVSGYVLKESAATDLLSAIQFVVEGKRFISPGLSDQLLKRREGEEALKKEKPGLVELTAAERRILKLIAEDQTTKEIADHLKISPRTVETHRQNICHKLKLSGSHSLLKFAYDHRTRL